MGGVFATGTLAMHSSLAAEGEVVSTAPVSELITRALKAAEAAHTPEEQHAAVHGVDKAFSTILERAPGEQAQACPTLQALEKKRQLILLEKPILNPENHYLDSCREELHKTIEDFYEQDRQELREKHGVLSHPDASLGNTSTRGVAQDNCAGKVGNYPPIEIDTTGGHSYGSYNLDKQNHHIAKPPGLAPKEIIFTLDDGPSPGRTEKALAAFEENCVHVTLFQVGQFMATPGGQALVKRELEAGHNIGNHTWDHPLNMAHISPQAALTELSKHQELTDRLYAKFRAESPDKAALYVRSPFFRFPGGNEAQGVLEYLHTNNMPNFTWQAGANDWLPHQTAETELQEALKELTETNGGIFIAHDTHQATVDMIPYLLAELNKRGFKIRHMIPKSKKVADASPVMPSMPNGEPAQTVQDDQTVTDSGSDSANFVVTTKKSWKGLKVESFAKQSVNVRTEQIKASPTLGPDSLYKLSRGNVLMTGDIDSATLTGNIITVDGRQFAEATVEALKDGADLNQGTTVYIWVNAIPQ